MMADRVSTASAFIIISIISVLFLNINLEVADGIPQVVDLEQDNYLISVSPDNTGVLLINATVRSPSNQNMMYSIEAILKNAPFWNADYPDSILIEPLGEWKFQIEVTAPTGEIAGKEVELEVTVTAETGIASGIDSCTIRVLPYLYATLESPVDYIIDIPEKGEFSLDLRNRGNVRAPVGLELDPDLLSYSDSVLLDPGEKRTVSVEYDLSTVISETDIVISCLSDGEMGTALEIRIIPDGELFHLLFSRGPFLILLPGMLRSFINLDFSNL